MFGSLAITARADDFQFESPVASTPLQNLTTPATSAAGGGLIGGASLYVLSPYFSNNPAFINSQGVGAPDPSSSIHDFDWNFSASPAIWIGYSLPGGLGVRARGFLFDHSSESEDLFLPAAAVLPGTTSIAGPTIEGLPPTPGLPFGFGSPGSLPALATLFGAAFTGESLSFTSSLQIYQLDGEATFQLSAGNASFVFAAGGRYMHMEQEYGAHLFGTANMAPAGGVGVATEHQTLLVHRGFDGGGPTLALQGNYKLGQTGLSLYGSARASLLVGQFRESASFRQEIEDPNGILLGGATSSVITSQTRSTRNGILPVAEVEAGLEYGLPLGGTNVFGRAAAVNQTYFNSGSASQRIGDLGLFGAQLSLGMRY